MSFNMLLSANLISTAQYIAKTTEFLRKRRELLVGTKWMSLPQVNHCGLYVDPDLKHVF